MTPPPPLFATLPDADQVGNWIERLGFPVVFIVAATVICIMMARAAMPRIDKWLDSVIRRNEITAETLRQMAEKSTAIQGTNANTLATMSKTVESLEKRLPNPICAYSLELRGRNGLANG